jgi:hypothetical protein
MKTFEQKLKSYIKYGAAAVAMLFVVLSTYFTTDEGFMYFVQNTMTGNTEVVAKAGVHLKMPFFTKVTAYKQVATIDATITGANFTRDLDPISVTFADTYDAEVPATFRYRLPTNEAQFRTLHKEFRSYDNLVDALLVNNSINVATVTATQYTGEEFIQGGVNSYKAQMEDQLRNGLYVTDRKQVTVEDSGYAPVSSTNSNSRKVETLERLVMKNIVRLNADGSPQRLANPLAEYGITVSQVTIGKPIAGLALDTLLVEKRRLVGEKISFNQAIDTNKTKAEAATQEREIEKQKAIQESQKLKELAIIAEQQNVAVEKERALKELVAQQKEKDVAVIQKEKELAIAEANRGIQQAAAQAAKFEAEAILAKGLAEAQVDAAKLQAKQGASGIYIAELNAEIAKIMYPALANTNITMPLYYAGGEGSTAPTSLDVFTTLGSMNALRDAQNQSITTK